MRKIDLLLGAAMLLGATGCAKNEAVGVGGVTVERAEVVITAETATTKTVYDEDTTTAYWNADDKIGVYLCRDFGTGYKTTIENLRYDNAGADHSSVSRFTSTATFNVTTGDMVVGYYPYSTDQSLDLEAGLKSDGSRRIARPFTLESQTQNGNASTAHIGANDFLIATPTAIAESMIEGTKVTVPFTFTHAFSIIKFNVKNEYVRSFTVRNIAIESASASDALSGKFAIDIMNPSVEVVDAANSVSLAIEDGGKVAAGNTFTGYMLVNEVNLPVGSTIAVETSVGTFKVQTSSVLEFHRGYVHTVNFAANEDRLTDKPETGMLSQCWGSWKLSTFCGAAVDFDVYMTLNDDYTFALYQRVGDYEVSKFYGSYTFDPASGIFGGAYDDNTPWATTYALEDVDDNTLTWVNTANESEISVYVREDIPATVHSLSNVQSGDVKRFL